MEFDSYVTREGCHKCCKCKETNLSSHYRACEFCSQATRDDYYYGESTDCTKMAPCHLKMLNRNGIQACKLLAVDGLTPEDGNIEANERCSV
ncbi:hypothetical protein M5K25_020293 [Dendrobium thyrsiflorum]|uniref:TNFR-Cys domain-containing protein n=1 Tax=Dendrobium thyrsiflorum TaxID=117978 RepID=A0ABD0U9N2_DENTH